MLAWANLFISPLQSLILNYFFIYLFWTTFCSVSHCLQGCAHARLSSSVRASLCWNTAHTQFDGIINWWLSTNQPITPSTFICRPLNHAVAGTSKGFHNQKRTQVLLQPFIRGCSGAKKTRYALWMTFRGLFLKLIFKPASLRTRPDL